MWFLIKAAFWFTVILLILPFASPEQQVEQTNAPKVEVAATIGAAQAALDDLTGLCTRQPAVCETGGRTLSALGNRAREGALVAYRFLDSRFGESGDTVVTGTVPAQTAVAQNAGPDTESASARPVADAVQRVAQTADGVHPAAGPEHIPHPYSPPR